MLRGPTGTLFDFVLDIVGTMTAVPIVHILSGGRARVALNIRPAKLPWHGVWKNDDGIWLIANETAMLIGLAAWAAIFCAVNAVGGLFPDRLI